jgi:hypothetical protein
VLSLRSGLRFPSAWRKTRHRRLLGRLSQAIEPVRQRAEAHPGTFDLRAALPCPYAQDDTVVLNLQRFLDRAVFGPRRAFYAQGCDFVCA